ncbi:MAG: Flp pilus assembly complex ATPase component TadA [Ruminococcus sp.]|nr:Flp pilus assembly complex ATPase component TadA [Ruminococcus sp.]
MTERTSFELIAEYLPEKIRLPFLAVKLFEREHITELRLNSGRAAALIYPDRVVYLTKCGLTANPNNTAVVKVLPADIEAVMNSLSHYSFHSCENQLREGVFVLRGGVRVGLSGRYNSVGQLTDITGLNFRISRNIIGCGEKVYSVLRESNCGIVICGGVNSGKTTILRDLCRLTGNREKVALIDERNEIACTEGGIIHNDVGVLTNVLTGCTRAKGIISAVRTLSPDYIFCDEISTSEDSAAILGSIGCGVKFCATVHGGSFREMCSRPIMRQLLKKGVFGYAVILRGGRDVGKIEEIRRLEE